MMLSVSLPIIPESKTTFDKLSIKIADIEIALSSFDPELKLTFSGAMEQFVVEGSDANIIVQTYLCALDAVELGEKIFDSGGNWQLYKNGEQYLFRLATPLVQGVPYQIARFNRDFSFGEILCERQFFKQGLVFHPFGYPIDELLFINFLARGRGVEVHACGLQDASGEGYLF